MEIILHFFFITFTIKLIFIIKITFVFTKLNNNNLLIMANLKIGSLQHKRSSVVNDKNGIKTPKLPTKEQLEFGEIAINYAKDYETLSIKNSSGDVVTFSSDSIIYGNIDEVESGLTTAIAEVKSGLTQETQTRTTEIGRLENLIGNIEAGISDATEVKVSSGTSHIEIESGATDGKVTYTISEVDIASEQALADEVTARTTADDAIKGRLDTIEGRGDGSIKKAVADAKAAIEGTFKEGDVQTLAALNTKIEGVSAAAKSYEIKAVTEGLGTNVKEAYALFDEDDIKAGATIKIYKDSALKSAELIEQELVFTYTLADNTEQIVRINVSKFLAESEFKNGLEVNSSGEVSVKVDEKSDTFLSVGEGGIKLSGVQSAINKAKTDLIGTADTGYDTLGRLQGKITSEAATRASTDEHIIQRLNTIQSEEPVYNSISKSLVDAKAYTDEKITALNADVTSTGETKVRVQVVETAGKITAVTVTDVDIASATGLTAEINRAKAAEKLNADAIAILNGDKTKDGSVAKALSDAKAYTDEEVNAAIITVNTTIDGVTDIVNDISVDIDNVDKKVNNITVNVESLFTEGNNMTGYTLSDLSKKNLYHSNGNTVKFVGYGNSAINPTTNEANLVMESFKDGIRTITIAYIKQNGSTITTQSVKTYSSNAFIMKISQSDYDIMKNAGTLDENTLYVIS